MANVNYFRVNVGDSWNDGESWSVNQYYEQSAIIAIDDESDAINDHAIIKALKQAGMINKYLEYSRFDVCDTMPDIYVEYYYHDDREPIMIWLKLIDRDSVERESNAKYLFPDRLTQVYNAI